MPNGATHLKLCLRIPSTQLIPAQNVFAIYHDFPGHARRKFHRLKFICGERIDRQAPLASNNREVDFR